VLAVTGNTPAIAKSAATWFTLPRVQMNLFGGWSRARAQSPESILIGSTPVPLQLVRNVRARRYILRVRRDGTVRVTIPRGGSTAFALDFARQHTAWIQRERERRSADAASAKPWGHGTEILFHGEKVALTVHPEQDLAIVRVGEHSLSVPAGTADLRPAVERYFWSLAEKELLPRLAQLAAVHQLSYQRAVVRNQRSRWGSCSPRRTISLNWRLIQAPAFVRDYMIVHELMHLREMNHSPRFWRCVEMACPEYAQAEAWLDEHAALLR
jgi:predicted metal-dependent hydrolase